MAKRKVDAENRGFQARWEAEYMFTEVNGKPVCLLCGESLAVMKEHNLRRYRNDGFPIIIACPVTAPRWFADVNFDCSLI